MFQYLDIILFVEATIYQMDEENEALCEQIGEEKAGDHSPNEALQQHAFQGNRCRCPPEHTYVTNTA